jgi:hypothetical protein
MIKEREREREREREKNFFERLKKLSPSTMNTTFERHKK